MTNLEILDAIRGGTTKPQDRSTAVALLVGSAAVFLIVGINQWDVQRALLLIVSIFIHECGHLAAMRACRYKNLKMLFIPFLGAVASGRPSEHNGLKIAIIAFAGPVAGLLAAGVALLLWTTSHSGVLLDFAQISMVLNGFNLLPILPLDGGHVLNEALLARHPKAELGFTILAATALIALATKLGTFGLGVIAVAILGRMKVNYDMGSAINRLRTTEGMMGGELTEDKIGQIREEVEEALPLLRKISNAPKLPAQIEAAWARVNKVFPRPAIVGSLLAVYFAVLLLIVPFGVKTTARLKLAPVLSLNHDGIQRMGKGDFKGAVTDFDKALELQPGNPVILMNRGIAKYSSEDFGGAIFDLSLVLEKKPDAQLAYFYRAFSHEKSGEFQEEIADCGAALRLKPYDPDMLASLGYAESRMGDVKLALSYCDEAVTRSPKNPGIIWQRAYVRDIAGDFAGAASDYAEAVGALYAIDFGRIRWAIDLRRQKLSDAGVGLRGRASGFRDPWMRSIGLYLTGAMSQGQLESQAESSAPDLKSRYLGQAFYYIGISHLLDGDGDGARAYFEKSRNAGLRGMGETGLAEAELERLGQKENSL